VNWAKVATDTKTACCAWISCVRAAASSASERDWSAPGRSCAPTCAVIVLSTASARSTPAWAARTVSCEATSVRYASTVATATSNCVRLTAASDCARAALAVVTFAARSPKSKGSQVTRPPMALPHTDPKLFEPMTGPDMDGMTLCGRSRPNTLLRVARLACASASILGK